MAQHRLYNLIEHVSGTENRYLLMDTLEGSAQVRSQLEPGEISPEAIIVSGPKPLVLFCSCVSLFCVHIDEQRWEYLTCTAGVEEQRVPALFEPQAPPKVTTRSVT